MTTEYDWIDGRDECKRDFSLKDVLTGFAILTVAMIFLLV